MGCRDFGDQLGGRRDVVFVCPCQSFGWREAAAVSPALLGARATAGMMLARKWNAVHFARRDWNRKSRCSQKVRAQCDRRRDPAIPAMLKYQKSGQGTHNSERRVDKACLPEGRAGWDEGLLDSQRQKHWR